MMLVFLKVVMMILEVLVSILIIGVVLLQRSKSQGAGGLAFGAGMGEQIFGTQAGNVLTRTTVILGIIFLVNTMGLSIVYTKIHRTQRSVVDSIPEATTQKGPMVPPAGAPMDVPPASAPADQPQAAPAAQPPAAPAAEVPAQPAPPAP